MYHKILVPIDGSPFSEGVLAYLSQVDDKEQSQIILLQVLEQERYGPYLTPGPLPISGQPIAEWDQYAQSYHASLAQELRARVSGAQPYRPRHRCRLGDLSCG